MRSPLKNDVSLWIALASAIWILQTLEAQALTGTAGDSIAYGSGSADSDRTKASNSTGSMATADPSPQLGEALNNCADPANVNLSISLAESAEVVITGLVVTGGDSGALFCAPSNSTLKSLPANASPSNTEGPDLLLDTRRSSSGIAQKGTILMVAVQCVHKGALACRRNKVDANALADAAGRCIILVKVPPQKQQPACSMYPGYRYMFMLSSKAVAACDGVYTLAHPKITNSVRPHLGIGGPDTCPPYPAWPSQSTDASGDGLANLLSEQCPGAANPKRAKCSDPCKTKACPSRSGVSCIVKSCEGRYMLQSTITPLETCAAVFISDVSGLPVAGCEVTEMQLMRQQRQSQKRVGIVSGKTETGVDSNGNPRLVDPQGLFEGRFGTALGAALQQQRQQAAAASPAP